jgi:hypothetical protein
MSRLATVVVFVLAGCVEPVESTPIPGPSATGSERGPESTEDRAEAVLDRLASFCLERAYECEAHSVAEVGARDVPESTRRTLDDIKRELRTLGFTMRWDARTRRFAVEPGDGLTYRGDVRSDP